MSKYLALLLAITFFACANNATETTSSTESSETSITKKAIVKNINQETFKIENQKPGVFVLDVRTPKEINEGKIRGALEIDFKAPGFQEKLSKLPKEKTYLVYCRSGGRSSKAAEMMVDMGFQDVSNLLGGYSEWTEE